MEKHGHPPQALDLAGLFQQHRNGLAGAVRAHLGPQADVQEVLQEAFLKAWKALRRGTQPKDPVAWMFVITMNQAKDVRRRRKRRPSGSSLEEVSAMQVVSTQPDPPHRLEKQEQLQAAKTAIAELGPAEKEVFLMRVSAGLSFAAIASSLNIPEGTAKSRMRRALKRLRQKMVPFQTDHSAAEESSC
ncbi:MAG: sigma-70 family RNA polymerase sigma factor [Planctomycetota bacterium]|nr:MAG: sigma-70 family RNA polymerase sigma factor [Planctomycetota bacterium]